MEAESAHYLYHCTIHVTNLSLAPYLETLRLFFFGFLFCFSRQGFSVALETILELALVDQVVLELTRSTCLCLPSAGIKGVHYHCLTDYILL